MPKKQPEQPKPSKRRSQSNRSTVAETVRQAIDSDERTINALAVEAGVYPIALWKFYRDGADVRVSTIDALCDVLGLELRKVGEQ